MSLVRIGTKSNCADEAQQTFISQLGVDYLWCNKSSAFTESPISLLVKDEIKFVGGNKFAFVMDF
jgi:hypothetical protein